MWYWLYSITQKQNRSKDVFCILNGCYNLPTLIIAQKLHFSLSFALSMQLKLHQVI